MIIIISMELQNIISNYMQVLHVRKQQLELDTDWFQIGKGVR